MTQAGASLISTTAAVLFFSSGVLSGCAAGGEEEERVVRYRPFFADNPEAWHGTRVVTTPDGSPSPATRSTAGADSLMRAGADRPTGRVPIHSGSGAGGQSLSSEDTTAGASDSGVKLVAGSVGQLFGLLLDSLSRGEHDLIARDLVGRSAYEHYESQGKNAQVFVDELARNQREVARTLSRMPMAERTPTVFMERVEAGRHQVWVLRLTGLAAKDLQYSRVWVELGRGDDAGTWRIVAMR